MSLGKFLATAAAFSLACAPITATPSYAASVDEKSAQKQAEIPTCGRKLGAMAIHAPQNNWWTALGLESPEALLKVFVMKSGCFTLVDRGAGFAMAQQERALASGGTLQGGSNIGAGQVRAADYILVPDIVSRNGNASGTNVGGILGGFLPGGFGAIASHININSKTADVVLTVTNVRTSEQQATEEGHGSQTDVGFGFGGGWGGWGGFGGAGISNYQNSAIGQVVVLAYIDAYTKLVGDLGGLSTNAKADAPAQAVTLARAGVMRATPAEKGKVLKPLDAGTILYPTGNKEGVWIEVADEVGNKGWVSQLSIANYRQ
ncbi:MAG TPA: CsgG/HfaB family protein [Rhizomicrobium sp.]|jgi:curli biogenesis system outer membrane secretion channel CsgG|nr:CsgG/HfaB family protein [Rhizomicrobium sp.]